MENFAIPSIKANLKVINYQASFYYNDVMLSKISQSKFTLMGIFYNLDYMFHMLHQHEI
jgi:hypothetical protein